MAEFVEVAGVNDLKDGAMKMVTVAGKEVLLARVAGKHYATQDRCQHMGGDLSRGKLEGTVVTCPLHGSQYDLKDGHVVRWTKWSGLLLALAKMVKSPRPLKTYEVKVEGDKVLVAAE